MLGTTTEEDYAIGIVCVIVALLFIYLLYLFFTRPIVFLSAWHHTFSKVDYSPDEIYKLVVASFEEKGLEGVTFSRVTRAQEGILGVRREYLKIRADQYIVYICAAPFAKDFFVSWRMFEQKAWIHKFLHKYPSLAPLAEYKTFYEQDTELMVKDYIHKSIMSVLEDLSASKGFRALSESERSLQAK